MFDFRMNFELCIFSEKREFPIFLTNVNSTQKFFDASLTKCFYFQILIDLLLAALIIVDFMRKFIHILPYFTEKWKASRSTHVLNNRLNWRDCETFKNNIACWDWEVSIEHNKQRFGEVKKNKKLNNNKRWVFRFLFRVISVLVHRAFDFYPNHSNFFPLKR